MLWLGEGFFWIFWASLLFIEVLVVFKFFHVSFEDEYSQVADIGSTLKINLGTYILTYV